MLHRFLTENHEELIERCRAKVARRPVPRPTPAELEHGIPLFLGQLARTLRLEQTPWLPGSAEVRGAIQSGKTSVASDIGTTAARHGNEMLRKGFTVDQVVHDYGDLCQAVTELAAEKNAPLTMQEFRTLNLCLDNAIAGAVIAYSREREQVISDQGTQALGERLGFLAHELRNLLNAAMLAVSVIKSGGVGSSGATGAVLDRSLLGMRDIIDRSLAEVRLTVGKRTPLERISIADFIEDAQVSAALEAKSFGCELTVHPIEEGIAVDADRHMLASGVANLLQNAFKFTRPHSHVSLKAHAAGDRVLIEIEDECGGLPPGKAEELFQPFQQRGADRTGLGLGLAITRRGIEASEGMVRVRDVPGRGCVFTIDLPRRELPPSA